MGISTSNILENTERVIEDGVNAYKNLCKSNLYVPGAGAFENYLCNEIKEYAKTNTSLEQYSIDKFAESFQILPRTILENSGLKIEEIMLWLCWSCGLSCDWPVWIGLRGLIERLKIRPYLRHEV